MAIIPAILVKYILVSLYSNYEKLWPKKGEKLILTGDFNSEGHEI